MALVQAQLVRNLLAAHHGVAEGEIEIVVISTAGDRLTDVPLSAFGGKGLFSKEIEAALQAGAIDLGVHSAKDMASVLPDGLELCAFLEREDCRDAFVALSAENLDGLPRRAKFGTSSLRRAAQILRLRPDLEIVGFRGNVDTRLKKLADGVAAGTLLAVAGLKRMGKADVISEILDPERFPPAPAQGAIGLEIRSNDRRTVELVAPLDHAPTHSVVRAERALLTTLDGSCRSAIGVVSKIEGARLRLTAEILSTDGRITLRDSAEGALDTPEAVGHALGHVLRDKAGTDLMHLLPG